MCQDCLKVNFFFLMVLFYLLLQLTLTNLFKYRAILLLRFRQYPSVNEKYVHFDYSYYIIFLFHYKL